MDVREVSERAACLPLERLEAEIQTLAGHLAAAECRWLLFVAEYDRRKGYEQWDCWSCAMWLGWKCGLAPRAAKEKVRVARALVDLPAITEAFAKGELSYSQVRALTRVAESATEATLLMWARHSTAAQLERIVRASRGCRRRAEERAEANERHDRRSVRWFWDDDGSLVVSARLDPEEGAKLIAAVQAVEKGCPAEHPYRDPETSSAADPIAARRADAFMAMVERALDDGSAQRRSVPELVAHVDVATMADGGDGRCHLEDGPSLAVETARRLACDAGVVVMLDDAEGNPLAASSKQRTVPAPLRRALHARDQGCRYPGCPRRAIARLEAHHVVYRSRGGATNLKNLVGLCKYHHRLVHEGGYSVERTEEGEFQFRRPDGDLLDPVPHPIIDPDAGGIEARNAAHGLEIEPDTIDSRWDGTTLDIHETTSALMWEREHPRWNNDSPL